MMTFFILFQINIHYNNNIYYYLILIFKNIKRILIILKKKLTIILLCFAVRDCATNLNNLNYNENSNKQENFVCYMILYPNLYNIFNYKLVFLL